MTQKQKRKPEKNPARRNKNGDDICTNTMRYCPFLFYMYGSVGSMQLWCRKKSLNQQAGVGVQDFSEKNKKMKNN